MKNYKTIIFDLDGTLLDTSEGIFNAVRHTEKAMGFSPLKDTQLREFIGPPSLTSYLTHYPIDEATALEAVIYHRNYQMEKGINEAVAYDGIPALLGMLKELGHKLGVATLKRQDITELTLKSANIIHFFDAICGIDIQESLTKSDIIKNVLRITNTNPNDAIMIGDSSYDAVGAKECKVDFIGVDYGFGFKNIEEIKAFHPKFIAYFADDLIHFFDELQ